MRTSLCILASLLFVSVFGQNTTFIKAYLNIDYVEFVETQGPLQPSNGNGLFANRLTIAVNQEINDRLYHELELSHFSFNRQRYFDVFNSSNTYSTSFDFGLRYEAGYQFRSESNWHFSLGLGVKPRYTFTRLDGLVDPIQNVDDFRLTMAIIPRMRYDLNPSLKVDLNPVLNLFELYHSHERSTGRDQGDSTWTPAAIGLRIGLAYKLTPLHKNG